MDSTATTGPATLQTLLAEQERVGQRYEELEQAYAAKRAQLHQIQDELEQVSHDWSQANGRLTELRDEIRAARAAEGQG